MEAQLLEWLNLIIRWVHIVAGIMWIGDSFLFMWMDSHLTPKREGRPDGVVGALWMVHSGAFYQVEKRKYLAPGDIPNPLYWFKWESAFTWLSGVFLLAVVYYLGGGAFLIDPTVARLDSKTAVIVAVGAVLAAWFVYDALWLSSLAKRKSIAVTLSLALLVGAAYALTHLLSARAAFIHTGSMVGTIMAANVWLRILPAQRALIAATKAGTTPDVSLGARAKLRSTHNHYLTLPLLFMMMSNHFPSAYGAPLNWLVLALLIFTGIAIKRLMNVWSRLGPWLLAGAVATLATAFWIASPRSATPGDTALGPVVAFAQAQAVIERRCITCHAVKPSDPSFAAAPLGVTFESAENIKTMAERIKFRAVVGKTMPLGNLTGMTTDERALLGRWVDQGASLE